MNELIAKWRKQAHEHREAAAELEDDAETAEYFMHIEAQSVFDRCADELEQELVRLNPTVPF